MPIQPAGASAVEGSVQVRHEYIEGLNDLEGFSHIILLYHFHRAGETQLIVTPYLDQEPRGVFATRAPIRPNPIGLSVVELVGVEGNRLAIRNVDILNGTPLLDIKPYVPQMEIIRNVRTGWLAKTEDKIEGTRADDRFKPPS
jgi:tRNA-Thr(GGU) m(6)t(6)A37 methyltransferase TsaA